MIGYADIEDWAAGLPESEAHARYAAIKRQFGWGGKIWQRADAQDVWENSFPDYIFDENVWAEMQDTYGWRHLADATDSEWMLIQDAAEDAKKALDKIRFDGYANPIGTKEAE